LEEQRGQHRAQPTHTSPFKVAPGLGPRSSFHPVTDDTYANRARAVGCAVRTMSAWRCAWRTVQKMRPTARGSLLLAQRHLDLGQPRANRSVRQTLTLAKQNGRSDDERPAWQSRSNT
jgi:hypothetical protein